jgi:hypothetical protein
MKERDDKIGKFLGPTLGREPEKVSNAPGREITFGDGDPR